MWLLGVLMKYLGWIFVFLWASGYIASSIGLHYTNPLSFITFRVAIALTVFIGINAFLHRGNLNLNAKDTVSAMSTGLFIQFLYPVFFSYALAEGISPAMLTIILGLQPILTLLISRDISSKTQILGILGCVLGTIIFSIEGFSIGSTNIENFLFALLSLLGVTFGSIIQKKYCTHIPIEKNMLLQCLAALVVLVPTTLTLSEFTAEPTFKFICALLWQALLISSLSSILLIKALQTGAVTNVSTYFSCVPAATGLMAYLALGSMLTTTMILGMIIIFGCTWLVQNPQEKPRMPFKIHNPFS